MAIKALVLALLCACAWNAVVKGAFAVECIPKFSSAPPTPSLHVHVTFERRNEPTNATHRSDIRPVPGHQQQLEEEPVRAVPPRRVPQPRLLRGQPRVPLRVRDGGLCAQGLAHGVLQAEAHHGAAAGLLALVQLVQRAVVLRHVQPRAVLPLEDQPALPQQPHAAALHGRVEQAHAGWAGVRSSLSTPPASS